MRLFLMLWLKAACSNSLGLSIGVQRRIEPMPTSSHSDQSQRQQQQRQRRTREKLVLFGDPGTGYDGDGDGDTLEHAIDLKLMDDPSFDELTEGEGQGPVEADEMVFSVSPLICDGDDEDDEVRFRPTKYEQNEEYLEGPTNRILDPNYLPLGTLTKTDVQAITGLMALWARSPKRSVEAAMKVERLLKRIVDDMRAGNQEVRTTTRMYTIAIDAWARIGSHDVLYCARAQQIHDGMIQTYRETHDPKMKPDTKSFNALLKAWFKSTHPSAVQSAETILQQMLQDGDVGAVQPDAATFSTIMDLYARVGTEESLTKAENLFELMTRIGVQKDVRCFSAFQNVYACSGRLDAPKKSMSILQKMLDGAAKGGIVAQPTRMNYNAVLCAYSRTPSTKSAVQAVEMLRQMESSVSERGYDVEPDRFSYILAILACCRCPNQLLGAKLAESVLERMEERARIQKQKRDETSSAAPPLVSMDLECFNTVLTVLSKSRDRNAVSRILNIISRMEKEYADAGQEHLRPTTRSWNAVLNAISRQPTLENAQRAERIVENMFKMHADGVPNVKPDQFSYSSVLTAYKRLRRAETAQRADDILSHMEQLYEERFFDEPPDVYHYTIVCSAWAQSRSERGPQRCLEILSRMREKHKNGWPNVKPTIRTYNAVLDCLSRSLHAGRAEDLLYRMMYLARNGDAAAKPDAYSFDAVINAYIRSNLRDAGKRAESILERGLEYAEEENGEMLKISSFTIILGFYGSQNKVADAPYRADYILNRLISLLMAGQADLSPHVSCFTNVMDAYAQQCHPNAGEVAERLLRIMIKLRKNYGASKLEVNTGVFNCVLSAWAESAAKNKDAASRAIRLLDLMEQKATEGDTSLIPNPKSYNTVLYACSRSSAPDKAFISLDVLNRIKKRQQEGLFKEQPPLRAYSLVINACAFSSSEDLMQDTKILDIANDAMMELIQCASDEQNEPSSKTFGCFVQAFERLQAPESAKEERLRHTISKCCELGRMDSFVLEKLKAATSDDMFERLVLGHIDQKKTIELDQGEQRSLKQKIGLSHFRNDCIRHGSLMNTKNKRKPVNSIR